MVIGSFLLGLVVSAILFFVFAGMLGVHDTDSLIWYATSVIIATICGCSAWVIESVRSSDEGEETIENEDLGLVKLRDIDVLSNDELEEIIEIYHDKHVKKGDYEQFQKYEKVLNELKETGYFSDEQYSIKITELKNYFKVD